mgnify:CR=1 FL=1
MLDPGSWIQKAVDTANESPYSRGFICRISEPSACFFDEKIIDMIRMSHSEIFGSSRNLGEIAGTFGNNELKCGIWMEIGILIDLIVTRTRQTTRYGTFRS